MDCGHLIQATILTFAILALSVSFCRAQESPTRADKGEKAGAREQTKDDKVVKEGGKAKHAQEPEKAEKKKEKRADEEEKAEEIVVTAPRLKGKGKIEERRMESPFPFTGISREDFLLQPKSERLNDIVDRLTGVYTTGDIGENKETGIRGMNHHFVRFEFDGIQLPGVSSNRDFRLNRISPMAIGDVIILRSPTAEYESDGIAGRILAELRPLPDRTYFELDAGYGLVDGPKSDGPGKLRDVAFAVGSRIDEHFAFNTFGDFNHLPILRRIHWNTLNNADGTLKEDTVEIQNLYWENINLIQDFGFTYDSCEFHFKPMFTRLVESKSHEKIRLRPGKNPTFETRDEDKPRTGGGVTLTNILKFGKNTTLETDLGFQIIQQLQDRDTYSYTDRGAGFEFDKLDDSDNRTQDRFGVFKTKLTHRFDLLVPQELKTGMMMRLREYDNIPSRHEIDDAGVTTDTTKLTDRYSLEEDYYAFFVQDEFQLFKTVKILPGVRFEYVNQESFSGDGMHDKGSNYDETPSVNAVWTVVPGFNLRGSMSRTVNRPSFSEMSPAEKESSDTITIGNPSVSPETSLNLETGFEFRPNKDLFLSGSLFRKDIKGLIEAADTGEDRDGKELYQYTNVGPGHVQGLELEERISFGWIIPPAEGLSLWANQTFLSTEVTEEDGTKRPFNNQPDFLLNIGGGYDIKKTGTRFAVNAKYQNEYRDIAVDEVEVNRERWYMDVSVSQRLGKHAKLTFGIDNVLNTAIEQKTYMLTTTEKQLNSYGRVFRVGIDLRF